MKRRSGATRSLAALLSAIAGYVDAIGFLGFGGFFVSFMSGNSTRFAAGVAAGSTLALVALSLIATFVAGVSLGAMTALRSPREHSTVIFLVAFVLVVAAAFGSGGWAALSVYSATLAMGAANSTFVKTGGLPVGLTYMTGTLVRMGQEIAMAAPGKRWAWLPYALHWAALVGGALAGALVHGMMGLSALWLAAGAALFAALWARSVDPAAPLA